MFHDLNSILCFILCLSRNLVKKIVKDFVIMDEENKEKAQMMSELVVQKGEFSIYGTLIFLNRCPYKEIIVVST